MESQPPGSGDHKQSDIHPFNRNMIQFSVFRGMLCTLHSASLHISLWKPLQKSTTDEYEDGISFSKLERADRGDNKTSYLSQFRLYRESFVTNQYSINKWGFLLDMK